MQRFLDGQRHRDPDDLDGQRRPPADAAWRQVVVPEDGLPNADVVMNRGVLLPLSHAIDDETLEFVIEQVDEFLAAPHG